MKTILLILCIMILSYTGTSAQERINTEIRQDSNLEKVVSRDVKMFYPEFRSAIIYLKGSRTQALMNLNTLSGKMMFINKTNDTLVLSNERDVHMIVFGDQKFIRTTKGFVEIIATNEDTILGLKTFLQHIGNQKYGAYGMVTNTAAIDNVTTIVSSTTIDEVDVLSRAGFQKKKLYYLITGNQCRTANQRGFLRVFSKKKDRIKEYLKENPVDFNKEENLVKLFNFCFLE